MTKNENTVLLPCPPLSLYSEQPKDQSKSELVDCPICTNKMWYSIKKKYIKELSDKLGKKVICECYTCFESRVLKDPSIMDDCEKVDIT